MQIYKNIINDIPFNIIQYYSTLFNIIQYYSISFNIIVFIIIIIYDATYDDILCSIINIFNLV